MGKKTQQNGDRTCEPWPFLGLVGPFLEGASIPNSAPGYLSFGEKELAKRHHGANGRYGGAPIGMKLHLFDRTLKVREGDDGLLEELGACEMGAMAQKTRLILLDVPDSDKPILSAQIQFFQRCEMCLFPCSAR